VDRRPDRIGGVRDILMGKREAREKAKGLGHKMGPFTPYGDKEYSYCENSVCKGRLTLQGVKVEGDALTHVCPILEAKSRNGR